MGHILTARERKALDVLSFDHRDYQIRGQIPVGIGSKTLDGLVSLGLLEVGPSERFRGQNGWRITPDAWRCMYGKTYEEIMRDGAGATHPLPVWS